MSDRKAASIRVTRGIRKVVSLRQSGHFCARPSHSTSRSAPESKAGACFLWKAPHGGAEPAEVTQGVQNKDAGTASKSIGTPWHGVKVMQVRGAVEEGSPSADKAYRPSLSVPGTSIWSCSTAPRCCWISPGAARCLLMVASWSCIATRHAEQRSATRLKWPDRFRKT